MRQLPLMVATLAAMLTAGCHDRRAGVEQYGKKLPYDNWNFSFIYPKNLPALVTRVYLEDGDIRESIFRRLDPMDSSDLSVGR